MDPCTHHPSDKGSLDILSRDRKSSKFLFSNKGRFSVSFARCEQVHNYGIHLLRRRTFHFGLPSPGSQVVGINLFCAKTPSCREISSLGTRIWSPCTNAIAPKQRTHPQPMGGKRSPSPVDKFFGSKPLLWLKGGSGLAKRHTIIAPLLSCPRGKSRKF